MDTQLVLYRFAGYPKANPRLQWFTIEIDSWVWGRAILPAAGFQLAFPECSAEDKEPPERRLLTR
jgi:hypothetical protein